MCYSGYEPKKIRQETWKTGQTLQKLRHAIALIRQDLKR
jgi:hypothetical protein